MPFDLKRKANNISQKINLPSNISVPSLGADARRQLSNSDRTWHVKVAIRASAALLSLIAFSLFAAAIPQWNRNFFHVSGPQSGDWQDGLPIAALLISFLTNTALPIYTLLTRGTRPLHPAITLTIDLIIWALLIPSITFAAWGGLFEVWRPAIRNQEGQVICNILNTFAKECNPILYRVGGLELGGVILSCFVWVLSFTTFVFSCIEVHRLRKSRSSASFTKSSHGQSHFVELNDRSVSLPRASDDFALLRKESELKVPGRILGRYR